MFRIHVSRQCFSLSSAFASPWISISNWGWRYAVHVYTIGPYCHSYGKTTFDRGFVLRMAAPSLCSLLDVGQLRCKNAKNASTAPKLPRTSPCPILPYARPTPLWQESVTSKWHWKKKAMSKCLHKWNVSESRQSMAKYVKVIVKVSENDDNVSKLSKRFGTHLVSSSFCCPFGTILVFTTKWFSS